MSTRSPEVINSENNEVYGTDRNSREHALEDMSQSSQQTSQTNLDYESLRSSNYLEPNPRNEYEMLRKNSYPEII